MRQSTANTFLWPLRNRKNRTIVTDTTVDRLLFDGGKHVVGVVARNGNDNSVVEYRAAQEVILSAGAIETPLILERSGIGNPEVLAKAGVDVKIESPNVGERVISSTARRCRRGSAARSARPSS